MSNYYEKELEIINTTNVNSSPLIKVFNINGLENTKFLTLNYDSALALIKWLQKNYTNKP